jgi:hypothetical protein
MRSLSQILSEGFAKYGNAYVDSLLKDFTRPDQAHPQRRAHISLFNPSLMPASREHLTETAAELAANGQPELAHQVMQHAQNAMPSANITKLWGKQEVDPGDQGMDQAAQGFERGGMPYRTKSGRTKVVQDFSAPHMRNGGVVR